MSVLVRLSDVDTEKNLEGSQKNYVSIKQKFENFLLFIILIQLIMRFIFSLVSLLKNKKNFGGLTLKSPLQIGALPFSLLGTILVIFNHIIKQRRMHGLYTHVSDRIVRWSHGVMVSTLDFESSDPSSNLGGTFKFFGFFLNFFFQKIVFTNFLIFLFQVSADFIIFVSGYRLEWKIISLKPVFHPDPVFSPNPG